MSDGRNSSSPTTAPPVGGVYNVTPPTLVDGQACAVQLDVNGQIKTTGGGSGGGNVNITGINGSAPALSNPLPVELSDGTNALGTNVNPVRVDPTGTTPQPVTATSLPLPTGASTSANQTNGTQKSQSVDASGNVQPAGDTPARSINVEVTDGTNVLGTAAHPVRTDPTGTTPQPVSGTVAATQGTSPWVNNTTQLGGTAIDTNSGNKSAGTQRVVLATDQPSLTNPLSTIASTETGTVYNGTTALTPKFVKISTSSSGASQVVAAVTNKKIRVLKWDLMANAAVNVKWQSHVTPTDLTGLYYMAANGGIESGFCPLGHFETVSGEALDINLSGAQAVGGVLTYVEV